MNLSEKIASVTVATVLFKVLFAGMAIKFGENSIAIGGIDSLAIAALLTPVLGALHLGSFVANKAQAAVSTVDSDDTK